MALLRFRGPGGDDAEREMDSRRTLVAPVKRMLVRDGSICPVCLRTWEHKASAECTLHLVREVMET